MPSCLAPVLSALVIACAACSRDTPATPPAGSGSGPREIAVRVPAGLRLARALDSLSVSVDPAATATTTVVVEPGMHLGIESEERVAAQGQPMPAAGRLGLASGTSLDGSVSTWNTSQDGLPVPGTRYVAEVRLVLFETDVPPGHMWSPRSGKHYKVLWTRTLRQAEE